MNLLVVIPVQHLYVFQVFAHDIGILLVGLALHTFPDLIRNRGAREALIQPYVIYGLLGGRGSCDPLSQVHQSRNVRVIRFVTFRVIIQHA